MSVFEFEDYKTFLNAWIAARPKRGRGEFKRISELLRVHSTFISHVLKGDAHFSLEQAHEVAQYVGLSELESDYLLELVQRDRAGTHALKKRFNERIAALRKRALQLKERLPNQQNALTDEQKAIFYSSWHFSAIRLMATLGQFEPREIRQKLGLSHKKMNDALAFLTECGICRLTHSGTLEAMPSLTHLGADSPHVWKHHQNWRTKAMERHFDLTDEELMYSSPLTISVKDMAKFRERIVKLIEELKEIVSNSEPSVVACLNIDWVRIADK